MAIMSGVLGPLTRSSNSGGIHKSRVSRPMQIDSHTSKNARLKIFVFMTDSRQIVYQNAITRSGAK